ncbi:MAG: universal stress protein [Bacteroidia bacterium]|jgi:nucleotide-binding universal stress UspA family protein
MINRILVPTDFSDVAKNALDFALDLCHKTNAEIHLLHVNPVPVADINFPQETYQLYLSEMKDYAEKELNALVEKQVKPSGIKYGTHTHIGFVNDEVIQFIQGNQIDLIVMGTTGASGLQELLIGSNTASIVGRSPVPVFVIPPSARHLNFKHVLYASDYSEPEFPAVSRLVYFAELYNAKITVIHAKTESDRYFNSENNFFVKNRDQIKSEQITIEAVSNPDITDAVNEYIDYKGVDMVVMAKHNRSWFDRIFHRSMSKRMTYHTRVPLLVLNK